VTVRHAGWLLAALLSGMAFSACGSSSADHQASSCPHPSLRLKVSAAQSRVQPPTFAPAAAVTALGTQFTKCATGTPAAAGSKTPLKGVRLFIVQGSQHISVAGVDAGDPNAGFSATFGLPPGLTSGPARVQAQIGVGANAAPLATAELVIGGS
jgi:hypothetical protein